MAGPHIANTECDTLEKVNRRTFYETKSRIT